MVGVLKYFKLLEQIWASNRKFDFKVSSFGWFISDSPEEDIFSGIFLSFGPASVITFMEK